MQIDILCPKCGKSAGGLDDSKIPRSGAINGVCPSCKSRITVKKGNGIEIFLSDNAPSQESPVQKSKPIAKSFPEQDVTVSFLCPKCGYERHPGAHPLVSRHECPKCGAVYSKAAAARKIEESKIQAKEIVTPPSAGAAGILVAESNAPKKPAPSAGEFFSNIFRHEIFGEALILAIITAVYAVGFLAAGVVLAALNAYKIFIALYVLTVVYGLAIFADRCIAFIQASKQDTVLINREKGLKFKSLGYLLAVQFFGMAPFFVALILFYLLGDSLGAFIPMALILLTIVFALLYVPMGTGMAAIYKRLHPAVVVKAVMASIGWYLASLGVVILTGTIGQGIILGVAFLVSLLGIVGGASLGGNPASLLQGASVFILAVGFVTGIFGLYVTVLLWSLIGKVIGWREDKIETLAASGK